MASKRQRTTADCGIEKLAELASWKFKVFAELADRKSLLAEGRCLYMRVNLFFDFMYVAVSSSMIFRL